MWGDHREGKSSLLWEDSAESGQQLYGVDEKPSQAKVQEQGQISGGPDSTEAKDRNALTASTQAL